MPHSASVQDEQLVRRCIELSRQSVDHGDAPFGSIIVKDGEILVEAENSMTGRISDHAEVIALHKAHDALGTSDLTGYTLYTSCEPCPMCSFMIREYKISRVVFGLASPFMGGYTKWPILQDDELETLPPFFGKPPEVVGPMLEAEAKEVLPELLRPMLGSDVK